MFVGLFLKPYFFFNIHVRHFIFGQCIGYIVSNKPIDHLLKFLILFNDFFKNIDILIKILI